MNDKEIWQWIRDGGKEEDEPNWRCLRHFHDPLNVSWSSAGLNKVSMPLYDSMIYWAQTPEPSDPENTSDFFNQYSWAMARKYFYEALLGGSEEQYAKTFRSLGQLMHLVSDAAVPAHVRNDAHLKAAPFGVVIFDDSDPYENWVATFLSEADQNLESLAFDDFTVDSAIFDTAAPDPSAPCPISALWDHDDYQPDGSGLPGEADTAIGLAEYTNAHFWTEDTFPWKNFSGSYPHPRLADTTYREEIWHNPTAVDAEDGITDHRIYFSRASDASASPFLAAGYWYYQLHLWNKPEVAHALLLDDKCHEAYARQLIPRAIGYSTALLDYFFRGTIEITPPDEAVYGVIDGSGAHRFSTLKMNLVDSTDGDDIRAGSLVAVARYKVIPDFFEDLSTYPADADDFKAVMSGVDYRHSVSSPIAIDWLDKSVPREFAFDFNADPIPAGVSDLSVQVVFQGTIGGEPGSAIAVGAKDLSEPTYFTFWNSTDEMPTVDGGDLTPTPGGGFTRDYIIAFTSEDPDPYGSGAVDFDYYDAYAPLVVIEALPPAAYAGIIALFDREETVYLVVDYGKRRCFLPWNYGRPETAQVQLDESGEYGSITPLLPPGGHRGVFQHHTYWQSACNDVNGMCAYLMELRRIPDDPSPVSLAGKLNFPERVCDYTPYACLP